MTIVDIIVLYIRMWLGLEPRKRSCGSLKINYRLAKAVAKKWDEYCSHIFDTSEYWSSHDHLEACLPTGSKLVRTRRGKKSVYFLYSYHYSGDDLLKTLQGLMHA
jgi:hypothetical protein